MSLHQVNSDDLLNQKQHSYFMVEHSDKEIIYVNANCIVKLIYEYIRLKAGVPDSMEMDLCDDDGVPKSIYEAPEGAYGTDFFEHRHVYYIVLLERNGNYIFINPNCNMKLIYEYLRVVTDIPENYEIDLCSEGGHLLGIYDAECSASGLQYLKPRASYYLFIFDYHDEKPDLYDPRPLMDYTNRDFNNVFMRIKTNFMISKDEYIREEDAVLIFEHMLTAYEEKLTEGSSLAMLGSVDHSIDAIPTKNSRVSHRIGVSRSSRKSMKSEGTSRVLQVWREEKRLKMAAAAIVPEEFDEISMPRGKSGISFANLPGLDVKNTDHTMIEEEYEEEQVKQVTAVKKHSKKVKKTEKKKVSVKESDQVPLKQDDLVQKAPPPIGTKSELSGTSVTSYTGGVHNIPSSSLNGSTRVCVTIRKFFQSHSSSTTSDHSKPSVEGNKNLQKDNKTQAVKQKRSNRYIVSKKRPKKII